MSEGAFEAKLSNKRESKSGIFLTFEVAPDDFKADLAVLRVGAHLILGWSEVLNVAVEPIDVSSPSKTDLARFHQVDLAAVADGLVKLYQQNYGAAMPPSITKDRRKFSDLPLYQQAAMRCQDKDFQAFVNAGEEGCADYVRRYCGVESRAEIDPEKNSGKDWALLEKRFQMYLTDRKYEGAKR